MPVHTASIYDASPPPGITVLATRYWPRGVRRDRVDEYVPALAPSRELLRAFRDDAIDWDEFACSYADEMRAEEARAALARLREAAATSDVTVMCVCRDEARCHRSLLRQLLD